MLFGAKIDAISKKKKGLRQNCNGFVFDGPFDGCFSCVFDGPFTSQCNLDGPPRELMGPLNTKGLGVIVPPCSPPLVGLEPRPRLLILHSTVSLFRKKSLFSKNFDDVITCDLRFGLCPPIKNPGYAYVPCQCLLVNFQVSAGDIVHLGSITGLVELKLSLVNF